MTLSVSSPVTGGAQTGLTTPTYTITADTTPNNLAGKQYAVTSIGGTQTGVDTTSSPSRPFTLTLLRPAVLRQLPPVNGATGILPNVPRNLYKLICRKGVTPLAGQAAQLMTVTVSIDVPAGADTADAPNVRACLSLITGAIAQISAGIGDTVVTGVV